MPVKTEAPKDNPQFVGLLERLSGCISGSKFPSETQIKTTSVGSMCACMRFVIIYTYI
jgi:hypothetical protein